MKAGDARRVEKNRNVLLAVLLFVAPFAFAVPAMKVNGVNGDYATFHYYINEAAGQTDSINVEFWPNDGVPAQVEVWSNLNKRDLATLNPDDPATVVAGQTNRYWCAYTMTDAGTGRYTLTLPVQKCGAYRLTCRYNVNGSWRWFGLRDTAIVVSDTTSRDMVVYELQVHSVDATGNDYWSRSTFDSLHDNYRWNLDYAKTLGVNTLWLMPFHPIGARSDGNYGEIGSPYSIKNLWQVNEILGAGGTRGDAMLALKSFMNDAKAKGMRIVFDTILNHTSKDMEIERNPDNPTQLASRPGDQARYVRYWWYSKYSGDGSCYGLNDKAGSPPYEYWTSATNPNQLGAAPADRNDFGKWCDTSDLFWGTYSALGNPQSAADGGWGASDEVKKLAEYYAYFYRYWIEQSNYAVDGFRCDFAQGIPPQAWEYIINKAKSVKPTLTFIAESLDGGEVSKRAARHFDVINESWVFGMLNYGQNSSGIRGIIDARRSDYGYAGILRGLINHDEEAPQDKWYTCARYAVGCALDGAPQMFMGEELGYTKYYGFSKWRVDFGKVSPELRNYYNMNQLWTDTSWDHDALWNRYAEVNLARQRSSALKLANQYYLDQVNGYGTHQTIFSVAKYDSNDTVLCFVNLQPGSAQSGTFNVNATLGAGKTYNVRNLASTSPNTYLWPTPRTGADLLQNGVYVGFPSDVRQQGSVAQFLKLEEQCVLWTGNTTAVPAAPKNTDDLWINAETFPIAQGQTVTVSNRVNAGAWQGTPLAFDYNDAKNTHWHVNLGKFAAGASIEYFVAAQNFCTTVSSATAKVTAATPPPIQWIGNVWNWPTQGQITSTTDFWVNIESWPVGTAVSSHVVYTTDGANWWSVPLTLAGKNGNNDWWHVNLGKFPAKTSIQYAIEVVDGAGKSWWANNNGSNYRVTVN